MAFLFATNLGPFESNPMPNGSVRNGKPVDRVIRRKEIMKRIIEYKNLAAVLGLLLLLGATDTFAQKRKARFASKGGLTRKVLCQARRTLFTGQ